MVLDKKFEDGLKNYMFKMLIMHKVAHKQKKEYFEFKSFHTRSEQKYISPCGSLAAVGKN